MIRRSAFTLGVLLAALWDQFPSAPRAPTNLIPGQPIGPTSTITCPPTAVRLTPGQSIQAAVIANHGGVTCLSPGVYSPPAPIYLKAGDTLMGEVGAIIDGSQVTQAWDPGGIAIVSGHNCDGCHGVIVRNLVIRNAPRYKCVDVYGSSNDWLIDHNEISGCAQGVAFGGGSAGTRVTFNRIHHTVTPYGSYRATSGLIEGNEFADNGEGVTSATEPKISGTTNITIRKNWAHHVKHGAAFWADGDNTGYLFEENIIEDTAREGLMIEISGPGIVRNNVIRRIGVSGIFLSTSRDVQVYGNTIDGAWRGINLFLNCGVVYKQDGTIGGPDYPYPGAIGFDLRNNQIRDNSVTVRLGAQGDVTASSFGWLSDCTPALLQPYLSNAKANTFTRNRYVVPTLPGSWWFWGGFKTWAQWQAIPQDIGGTIQ